MFHSHQIKRKRKKRETLSHFLSCWLALLCSTELSCFLKTGYTYSLTAYTYHLLVCLWSVTYVVVWKVWNMREELIDLFDRFFQHFDLLSCSHLHSPRKKKSKSKTVRIERFQ
jgi:hypothetical protein